MNKWELNELLLITAEIGDLKQVRDLIHKGADVNHEDFVYKETPLHKAVINGHEPVASYLLRHGSTVDARNRREKTALHYAAINGKELIVFVLLTNRALVNAADSSGQTPLHLAAMGGHRSIITSLLNYGAKFDEEDSGGNTPLSLAAKRFKETQLHSAARLEIKAAIPRCIQNGDSVNTPNSEGSTPLHHAARNGQESIASALLSNGALVNTADLDGDTPLHVAAYWDHESTVSCLIAERALLDTQNKKGETALDLAEKRNNQNVIRLLKNILTLGFLPMMRSDKIFSDLMKKGSYKSYDNKVYFSGPCMVGKTTLASVFIGDEIPKTWLSTNGLTLFFGRNGIDLEHKTMIPLQNKMEEQQQSIQKKDALEKLGRCEIQDSMNTYEEYITNQSSQTEEKQSYKENKEKPMIHQLEHDEESYSTQLIREDEETYLTPYTTSKMANFSYPTFMEKKNNIKAYSVHQTKESIREQIMKQVRSGRYNMKIAPSDLVDFGGQRCFDLTHQLFIQYKGTFVLLFDGSEGLLVATDQPDITAIETLIHWVDSVLMCCNFGEDIMPVILFGATHKDKVPQERQESLRKDYINELTTRFNKHRHTSHIRYNDLFFMNATDPNDSEIKRLQNTLVEIALRQPTWGQMMPVAWVPLELSISDLCEQGTTILRKDELTEINQNNEDLAISSEQLEVFITKQHSLGKLMYFNQPGLNQFIVIQPTSMVNILRSFITDKLFWPEDVRIENIFERLHQTSMIRKEDLYIIWSQDPFDKILPTDEHKDFAICLLIHLEVLVESKNFKNENISNHYLVPCMVKKRAPKEMMNIPNLAGRSICLSYNLKNLDIPSALAFKLIGAVTSIWSLKKTNEQLCLYFQAAVLEVDAQTDMRLFMERNCVTVCLVHNTSNDQISPDVAASIQECLTQALKGVIEFYLRTFGKYQPNYCVESMYDIEFGIICKNNDRCFISEHSLGKTQRWKCKKHGIEHDTKYLLYWIFEKSSKCCESDCSGLAAFKLDKQPSDKQLVRLAKQMNQIKFREFMIHLGFTANEVDETRSRYERNKPLEQNAMMLFIWKEKETIPDLKLKDFLPAIESIGYSQHLLCQVFGEDTSSILVLGEKKLYDTPNDDILEDLPTKMGNCVIQLGIELGLTIYDVEEVIYNNYGKMRDQIKGILTKWKHMENPKPTMFRLMTAVKECKSGGFAFLCGSLHKCQKEH